MSFDAAAARAFLLLLPRQQQQQQLQLLRKVGAGAKGLGDKVQQTKNLFIFIYSFICLYLFTYLLFVPIYLFTYILFIYLFILVW